MVTRIRLRAILTTLALYALAAALIGYFGVNAYSGPHGLRARQDLLRTMSELQRDLSELKAERRNWEHRVSLLRADNLDPDMLDERARARLGYLNPKDLVLLIKPR